MERPIILPGFIADMTGCLEARGLSAAPLLRDAGLPDAPDAPVTNQQYGRLWRLTALALDDEFVGLAGRAMRPGSFALMCQAVLHTGSLEHALRRALRFLNAVLDDPKGELRRKGGEAEIVLRDAGAPRSAFAYRTYWLVLMGLACWLVGRRIPLRQLDFACPAPADRADYRQFFGAPVQFGRPLSRLTFDAAHLALPPIRSEAALRSFLRDSPANILVRYRHEQGVSTQVRARLAALPPAEWPDFATMAAGFGLSPATLRRRLRADGQSFAALRDEIRMTLAQKRLARGGLSLAEIAAELGYSEPSAFHRAFVKWTGQRPGALRDSLR